MKFDRLGRLVLDKPVLTGDVAENLGSGIQHARSSRPSQHQAIFISGKRRPQITGQLSHRASKSLRRM